MHVTKKIDLSLLEQELARAAVPFRFLSHTGTDDDGELFTHDQDGQLIDLPPEAGPVVDAHDASKPARTKTFEVAEDAERLALVAERSATDPAFAALADLALGKQGV